MFFIQCWWLIMAAGTASPDSGKVFIAGSLQEIMHGGDLGAKIKIGDLGELKDVYGLGAVAGLKGEIMIDGNRAWIATAKSDGVSVTTGTDAAAALLVYTRVPQWRWLDIPAHIGNQGALQQFIQKAAGLYGLDTAQPIPFLLQGKTGILKWHVIDWPEGQRDHTPQNHRNSGLHGTVADQHVAIVGFYSEHHQGVFTHHDSHLHMHVRFSDNTLVGHVDNLNPKGLRLALPATESWR